MPDVLLQSHSASLDLTFYDGEQFPREYRNEIFASEHGSWNRARRTGYKVIRVPMKDGKATGQYEDFLVGVVVARDGSLMVTDDGSGTVWRVGVCGQEAGALTQAARAPCHGRVSPSSRSSRDEAIA